MTPSADRTPPQILLPRQDVRPSPIIWGGGFPTICCEGISLVYLKEYFPQESEVSFRSEVGIEPFRHLRGRLPAARLVERATGLGRVQHGIGEAAARQLRL